MDGLKHASVQSSNTVPCCTHASRASPYKLPIAPFERRRITTPKGRQVYSKVFRGGDLYELDAGCNTAYDFDLQEIAPFPEPTKLRKTDMVRGFFLYDLVVFEFCRTAPRLNRGPAAFFFLLLGFPKPRPL